MTCMPCPNIDVCHSSDFKLVEDGRIVCADDDCGQIFGRWTAEPPHLPGSISADEPKDEPGACPWMP
jgi:hypothetical protein